MDQLTEGQIAGRMKELVGGGADLEAVIVERLRTTDHSHATLVAVHQRCHELADGDESWSRTHQSVRAAMATGLRALI